MNKVTSIFLDQPPDFKTSDIAAACYCECKGKILLLMRNSHKSLGDTWGVPAGKLEEGETPRQAVLREVFEEVGLRLLEEQLEELPKIYVRRLGADVILYRFRTVFLTLPSYSLNLEEHSCAKWFSIEEALTLPHTTGGVKALAFYEMKGESMRDAIR